MSETKHLWEHDHPYYCHVGNYFKVGCHDLYESWEEYIEDWKGYDVDQNLIWRWDAELCDDPNYFTLTIFRVLQRKARNCSQEIKAIPIELENEVRKYLIPHFETMMKIWEGVDILIEESETEPCPKCNQESTPATLVRVAKPKIVMFECPQDSGGCGHVWGKKIEESESIEDTNQEGDLFCECGLEKEMESCHACHGDGGFHECGDDTCVCLDKSFNEVCGECFGDGEYPVCPNAEQHVKEGSGK